LRISERWTTLSRSSCFFISGPALVGDVSVTTTGAASAAGACSGALARALDGALRGADLPVVLTPVLGLLDVLLVAMICLESSIRAGTVPDMETR
jgi:hypothetical protein